MAMGGSTNAVMHLIAIAGRLGIRLTLDDFDRISRRTACIVNVKPSGEYLMEDLFHAGGVPAVMNRIRILLHGDCATVNGKTIGENISDARTRERHGDPDRAISRLYPKGASRFCTATWLRMAR